MKRRSTNQLVVNNMPKIRKVSPGDTNSPHRMNLRNTKSSAKRVEVESINSASEKGKLDPVNVQAESGINQEAIAKITWFTAKQFDKVFKFCRWKSPKSFEVSCTLCTEKKKLAVSSNSSSNLKSHLQKIHRSVYANYTGKNDSVDEEQEVNDDVFKFLNDAGRTLSQDQFERLVLLYIVDTMDSFRVVEHKSFKLLVLKGRSRELRMPTRKSIVQSLIREYQLLKNGQIAEYSSIKYFCVTTDLWSSRRRGYLGMTIHWICPKTFARKRNAIACRRMKGIHSAEILAFHIDDILRSFGIPMKKVLRIITDGASNFKKAFKERQRDVFMDDSSDDDEEIDFNITELTRMLSKGRDNNIVLPPHARCASHKLCLTLTADLKPKKSKNKKRNKEKAKFDRKFRRFRRNVLDPVLKKCTDLFHKQQQSSKAADMIHAELNRYLVTPCPTRWNSLYDSLVVFSELLTEHPVQIQKICDSLGLDHVQPNDHQVLKEYIQITESVADALDIFQGEEYMYFGVYAPTVCQLKEKVNSIRGLKYCQILQTTISRSIDKRFTDAMTDDNLMAAMLHPLFKTYPIFGQYPELQSRLTKRIAIELHPIILHSIDVTSRDQKKKLHEKRSNVQNQKKFKKLFNFDDSSGFAGSPVTLSSFSNTEAMVHKYLASPDTSMAVFDTFPEIGELFIKYNTPLCSSAPCERLFSIAKQVLKTIRCRLLDKHFEIQLLLKANLFPSSRN